MKTRDTLFIVLLLSNCMAFGQVKSPSDFFPKEKAKVLVVGTFHFDYPGLDAQKTGENDKIDVLEEPKKSEITQLVEYVKQFNPNKIMIEATPKWNAIEKLEKYKQGEYRDKRDERFQIAFRIAEELKQDKVYSIDAGSFAEDLERLDSAYCQQLFENYDFESDDPIWEKYGEWYSYEDELPSKMNLLDYFKYINSEEYHRYDYGAYLIGDFKLDNHRGADVLSIWWYNRNLRIFRNIQKMTDDYNDRILILIGNGHASVLRQLLESSPEYEFIEFDSLK